MVRFLDQRGVRKVLSHCRQGYRYHTHKLEFPKAAGALFGGPYNKDPTIQGTILGSLGSPNFGSSRVELMCSPIDVALSLSHLPPRNSSHHFEHVQPEILKPTTPINPYHKP